MNTSKRKPLDVYITVERDGWTDGMQLSVNVEYSDGRGHGYRIAGPKFNGSSQVLKKHSLNTRDINEIEGYLKMAREALGEVEKGENQ